MFKFGFELEGFYTPLPDGKFYLPPKNYPTDGFPGLIEVRTSGGDEITRQLFDIYRQASALEGFAPHFHEHTYSPQERTKLRARESSKGSLHISNIYGRSPKALGNRTLASFQINVSYQTASEWTDVHKVKHPAKYGLFDFYPIVKGLDEVFADVIHASGRQPGFYAIKDNVRLEYRSLPSSAFPLNGEALIRLADKINSVFNKGE